MFLYTSVDLEGEDKALALQSIDTLKTVVCDQDLVPRISELNMLPELLNKISVTIGTIKNVEYMDFLNDFLVSYANVLDDKIIYIAV
jgi:small-conductance mechanosensitive channel